MWPFFILNRRYIIEEKKNKILNQFRIRKLSRPHHRQHKKKYCKSLHKSKNPSIFAPRLRENAIRNYGNWKFGWVAETSSLLNCRTGYRTGGSNPPASASVSMIKMALSSSGLGRGPLTAETRVRFPYALPFWKFGWVAETSSLLNCRTGYRTGGSNPPACAERLIKHCSQLAIVLFLYLIQRYFILQASWTPHEKLAYIPINYLF